MNQNMRKMIGLAASAALAAGAVACGSDDSSGTSSNASGSSPSGGGGLSGQLAGAGSSAQDAAQEAWRTGFQMANPDVTVSYDPVGSGGGREQFTAGGTAFGGTDDAFADEELKAAQKRCGGPDNFVELPVYVSPIAVIYNLDGVDDLQLSPETLAKVFKGAITQWDDPAIKSDNPDAKLPSERIAVVHRSDESGTTENFTDYLSQAAGGAWSFDVSGDWPVKGQEAADGTSGVVDAVQNGANTIGYADASQAGDLGIAKVKVGDMYIAPSAEAAAKILESSPESDDPGENVFTFDLKRDTSDSGIYPIVLVSYEMACTKYDKPEDGKLVQGYLEYVISAEGQDAAAKNAGSAPISDSLRSKIEPSVKAIGAGA